MVKNKRELLSIKRPENYNLRSSSYGLLLATPTYRSRVTLGDRSFQVAAPALWNRIYYRVTFVLLQIEGFLSAI